MTKCIAVTGASGFVGHAVRESFSRSGLNVLAITGHPQRCHGTGTVRKLEDIAAVDQCKIALAGADVVLHLAARVHVLHETASDAVNAFRSVNVAGTQAMARAAREIGVQRFIYLSSIKASAEPLDPYGQSKREAEGTVRAELEGSSVGWVILRPPLVYGPGVTANFLSLLRLCDTPWPLPFGRAQNRRSLLFIGNLVDALRRVALNNGPSGTWNIADGDDLSVADLVRRLRRMLGRPTRLHAVPPRFLTMLLAAAGRRLEAERLLGELRADSSRFQADYDWRPPYSAGHGLLETVAWYKSRRAVDA